MLIEPPCVPSLVAFGRCLAGWTGMVCSPATVGRHRSVSLTASHPEVRRGHESCQEKERANVPVSLEPAPPNETVSPFDCLLWRQAAATPDILLGLIIGVGIPNQLTETPT